MECGAEHPWDDAARAPENRHREFIGRSRIRLSLSYNWWGGGNRLRRARRLLLLLGRLLHRLRRRLWSWHLRRGGRLD